MTRLEVKADTLGRLSPLRRCEAVTCLGMAHWKMNVQVGIWVNGKIDNQTVVIHVCNSHRPRQIAKNILTVTPLYESR